MRCLGRAESNRASLTGKPYSPCDPRPGSSGPRPLSPVLYWRRTGPLSSGGCRQRPECRPLGCRVREVPDAGPALDSPTGDRRPSQPRGCLGGHQPVGAGFRQARCSGRRPCRQHTIGPGPAHGRRLGAEEHRLAVAQPQSVAAELLVGHLPLSTNASATSPFEQRRAGCCFRARLGRSRC
jgi:hypothetical protein